MIGKYFTQAWTLMKQNKLFTIIYVAGTGLSIALIMTLFIIYFVKLGPVYPEYNRDRTLVIKPIKRYPKGEAGSWMVLGGGSYYVANELLAGLPHVEQIAAIQASYWENYKVSTTETKPFEVNALYVNGAFWNVFSFHFTEGKPFTQSEVEAKIPTAILSESLAQKLFATTRNVTGRHFLFNGKDYRAGGVVKDVSNATPDTAADLWLPLLNASNVKKELTSNGLLGNIYTYLLVDDADNLEQVQNEVVTKFSNFVLQDDKYDYDLMGQPDPYWKSTFRQDLNNAPNIMELAKNFLYILLALLFIPALNLSGMISSRMNNRIAELGIRKVYGAPRRRLLEQILCENLLLTLLGGIVGLLLSYLVVLTASDWILTLFDKYVSNVSIPTSLTFEMLFNPMVFCCTFAVCIILNLISALIPAHYALRHPIIESLNTKR